MGKQLQTQALPNRTAVKEFEEEKNPTNVVHLNRPVAALCVPWSCVKPSDANSGLDQTGSGANVTNPHEVMWALGKCKAPRRDDN